jgi:hypothetical protein
MPLHGKQLYKGGVHLELFQACVDNTSLKLYYNDITSSKFHEMQARFPIDHWMMSRGLIADPAKLQLGMQKIKWNLFSEFHDTLCRLCRIVVWFHTHLIKNAPFMGYFSVIFSNPHKVAKNTNQKH